MTMTLPGYERTLKNRHGDRELDFRIVTFDPGETTGWACFKGGYLDACGQFDNDYVGNIEAILDGYSPGLVVYENYRVYAHKISANVNSEIFTTRLIGKIELLCEQRELPYVKQMAHEAKGFATDTKLKQWEFWQRGMKHSRDAIRHGLYFLFFGDFSLIKKLPVDDLMQNDLQ